MFGSDIMRYGITRQRCIRVVGMNSVAKVIDISQEKTSVASIMRKIMRKFGAKEDSNDAFFGIFVVMDETYNGDKYGTIKYFNIDIDIEYDGCY